jgi:hypothetical protein
MGVQCRCNNPIRIKDGAIRVRPSGTVYQRKTVQCGARQTLAKNPKDYIRLPKCRQCGGQTWMVDRNRIRRLRSGVDICGCGGYHFQHRRGSKFCYHHPNAEQHHTERYEG